MNSVENNVVVIADDVDINECSSARRDKRCKTVAPGVPAPV
ncbi:hypothetical protein UYSO10_5784 [Kosakonia radicincitans]|nr:MULTISPECIES: hypothetical protein [Kosakonia]VVT55679.1 hypothetical protein UYSO10_5784 [Kosakonia radicincitans]